MLGWVLVDNLRRPRRATRSAVRHWTGLRPMVLVGTYTSGHNAIP